MADFTDTTATDFSQYYTGAGAPTDQSDTDVLFKELTAQATAAAAATAPAATVSATPATPAPAAPAPAPATVAPAATPSANPSSTANPANTDAALLERLKPIGITDLAQLKGKTDIELHQMSSDVLSHEQRQAALGKWFFKNQAAEGRE